MAIHAVTLFLGAFLLFEVQPLIGKLLLPGFGGASSVWMACLMFFQTVLLGGYAYAHLLASRLGPRAQGWTHASLLALMLPLLPLEPSAAGAPELVGESPTLSVLIVLATSVGVPFFLLSATSPLLQLWFARLYPGRSPYRLYATSNCGSLLALLTYPVWVEPNVSLRNQAWTWSLGVVVLICLLWYCAAAARRSGVAQTLEAAAPPSRIEQMVWLVLAATGSALLLGTTNQLSQNVAPVPFLWILPLALYLLTFILCFESDRFYSREVLGWMLVSSILGTVVALIPGTGLGLVGHIGLLAFALFTGCMVCHGELARARPAPVHLTRFYLLVSAGGALGGVFVTVIAPLAFPTFWELPVALGVICLLRLIAPGLLGGRGAIEEGDAAHSKAARPSTRPGFGRRKLALAATALSLVALLGPPAWAEFLRRNAVLQLSRNFYGVLRVSEKAVDQPRLHRRELMHGNTLHGTQFLAEDRRRTPTSYYGPESGVALAFRSLSARSPDLRVGVVGLGAGTLAAYAEAGMTFRFYEIDPEVVSIAEERFSFLADARSRAAHVRVRAGDGRRLLEEELARGARADLHLLVLDAFSGDAIPVHLLTAEAFDVYLRHLRPDGVLAIHISNRYLDLTPVVRALGASRGLTEARIDEPGDEATGSTPSSWMLLARDLGSFGAEVERRSTRNAEVASVLWTDDYSSLLPLLR